MTAPRAGVPLLAFCGVPSLTMLDRRHRGGALSWVPTLSKGAPTGSAPGIGRIEAPLLWPNERPRVPNIVKGGNRGERAGEGARGSCAGLTKQEASSDSDADAWGVGGPATSDERPVTDRWMGEPSSPHPHIPRAGGRSSDERQATSDGRVATGHFDRETVAVQRPDENDPSG
jgi:hypothetical protein